MSDKLERVKYRNSALREVIFQVRFPSILRIDAEAPVEFQELIRQHYPLYTDRKNEAVINIGGQEQSVLKNHNHEFVSTDGKSKVNLTNSFVAISTLDYDRWEVFRKQCKEIVSHFLKVYNPAVTQRIGLRYKDLITRSRWGLLDVPWGNLVKEDALGLVGKLPEDSINRYVLDCEIKGEKNVNEHRHFEIVRDSQSPIINEKSFLIDCDYFSQGIIPTESIFSVAEELHEHSSSFIRSIITETLDTAMEPVKIEKYEE